MLQKAFVCFGLAVLCAVAGAAEPVERRAISGYPAKTVKVIVPLTAGGPTDILARIIAQPLARRLGQPVIIENRPGAGGNIGAEVVAKAAPDGYTLFLGTSGPLSINTSIYRSLTYDAVRDFAPISAIALAPFVVVVSPALPVRTLGQLIDMARQAPGKLNAGSVTGSAAHLATELFKSAARVDITHIPYKGAAPATTDLIAGQIDLSFASTPGALPQIRAGKVRALAVTSLQRLPQLPDVPAVAESGLAGFDASVWYGLVAPANTPPEVIKRLNAELAGVLQDPSTRDLLISNHFVPTGSTPEKFAEFISSETAKWGEIVKTKSIHAD